MDINTLENNLNDYEANSDRAIALALQNTIDNQALLRVILDLQVRLIASLTKMPVETVYKDVQDKIDLELLTAQARTSSRF